jgi:hypothetical protein
MLGSATIAEWLASLMEDSEALARRVRRGSSVRPGAGRSDAEAMSGALHLPGREHAAAWLTATDRQARRRARVGASRSAAGASLGVLETTSRLDGGDEQEPSPSSPRRREIAIASGGALLRRAPLSKQAARDGVAVYAGKVGLSATPAARSSS